MRTVIANGDYVPAATTGNRTAYHVLSVRPEFDADRMPATAAGRKRFWRQIEALRSMGEIRESSIRRKSRHSTAVLLLADAQTATDCADAPNE
jgi:hypothetical protein